MQILLINDNSSVSKLINLTAKKYDYSIEEINDITELKEEHKDIIFIDDAISKDLDIELLKQKTGCSEFVYIASKGSQAPQEYKYTLEKPFLPSDFQNIVENIIDINKTIDEDSNIEEIVQKVEDFTEEKEEFSLDELEIDEKKDEILEDESLNGENDLENKQIAEVKNDKVQSLEDGFDKDGEEELSIDEDLFVDDEDSAKGISDNSTTILDKEDIEEVKELLDENEDIEDELQTIEKGVDRDILNSTQESFATSDINDDSSDSDNFSSQNSIDEEKQSIEPENIQKYDDSEDLTLEDKKLEENVIEKEEDKKDTLVIENIQSIAKENESFSKISDSKQNNPKDTINNNTIDNKQRVGSAEELDKIDEQSLKELFGQSSDNENEETPEISNIEEEMEVESFEEIKPTKKKKKKNKKKKLNQEVLSSLQEEITSKLLDIDTLREVLDGMEIRIKFYNKNKK